LTAPTGPAKPAFIGLSGAIASGKSEALAALGRLGAETLSTDGVTHELLDEPATLTRLVERWGEDVGPGGRVDRARIGEIVFAEPDELRWLESVLHPLVGERVAAWRGALGAGTELAVVEVPLLFEAGMEPFFDATLVVVAGDERRARWAGVRGTAAVEGRSARQLSESEKAKRATFVVANDGDLADLERSLRELWPQLVAAGEGE
jgi:dephospho-CoA kinase